MTLQTFVRLFVLIFFQICPGCASLALFPNG